MQAKALRHTSSGILGGPTKITFLIASRWIAKIVNRADRRSKGVVNQDAFRTAFVQAEIVMRQALAKKIQIEIDKEEDEQVKSGLQRAEKIVMGDISG